MTFFRRLTKIFSRFKKNQKGVALFIVLAAMATLSIFVAEITYVSQINQKLAYDRLDQIKATALAKSGLRIALLRIRAYAELRKTIGSIAKSAGAGAAAVNQAVPKGVLEKIWGEPLVIPFTGDISSLPSAVKDAMLKFRKDSGMEGKLYMAIYPQSSKFNLNSTIAAWAPSPSPTAKPGAPAQPAAPVVPGQPSPTPTPGAAASATPVGFDQTEARNLLVEQMKNIFQKKFDDDSQFRDQYRNFRIEDLADEILGWSDMTYESRRQQVSTIPFKQAPFYDLSELHYLPSMDDEVYTLLAPNYTATVVSELNVNKINDAVLRALVPQMTDEERKKFFEYRDGGGSNPEAKSDSGGTEDHLFTSGDDFIKYIGEKVALFAGNTTKINDFKTSLAQRGIRLITEESNFIIHIEATVQQTKRTLEAYVSVLDSPNTPDPSASPGSSPSPTPTPTPAPQQSKNGAPVVDSSADKSNLKITQLRFL